MLVHNHTDSLLRECMLALWKEVIVHPQVYCDNRIGYASIEQAIFPMNGYQHLVQRITLLDQDSEYSIADQWNIDIKQFLHVIEQITMPGTLTEVHQLARISAVTADKIVNACCLLARLQQLSPEIVIGPLATERQFWITGGRPAHLPPRSPFLDEAHFVPTTTAHLPASTKPCTVGLFTATGLFDRYSM